jgi:hypothetical protein
MLKTRIEPQRYYAGLDLLGHSNPAGITLEEAQAINCNGDPVAVDPDAGPTDPSVTWGTNQEVTFVYAADTHVVKQVALGPGYTGTIAFTSRSGSRFGQHSYEAGIGTQILRDGVPWTIRRQGTTTDFVQDDVDELYDAVIATFDPTRRPLAATDNCKDTRFCLSLGDAGDGTSIIGVRPVHFYIVVKASTTQPEASTPVLFYNFWTTTPFEPPPPPDAGH